MITNLLATVAVYWVTNEVPQEPFKWPPAMGARADAYETKYVDTRVEKLTVYSFPEQGVTPATNRELVEVKSRRWTRQWQEDTNNLIINFNNPVIWFTNSGTITNIAVTPNKVIVPPPDPPAPKISDKAHFEADCPGCGKPVSASVRCGGMATKDDELEETWTLTYKCTVCGREFSDEKKQTVPKPKSRRVP